MVLLVMGIINIIYIVKEKEKILNLHLEEQCLMLKEI